jgi:hypothetical protein
VREAREAAVDLAENSHACGWIAGGAGAAATGIGMAPITGGVSAIVGIFSGAMTLADAANLC